MMKMTSSVVKILSTLCITAGFSTVVAQEIPPLDDLNLALRDLGSLEIQFSNTDPRLAEPLFQLAREFSSNGRFEDAHAALDRGQQIVRMNEGLFTRTQIPYIQQKIENFADWQNWDQGRNLLEHLMWLHRTKTVYISDELIADFMELGRLHLRGISEDLPEFQAYHFRRASAANWLALASGERLYGDLDSRMVPIIYELVKQYHLQAEAVTMGGRTSYELREIVPGSDWVRDRDDIRRHYHATGRRLLSQIKRIYSEATPVNLEGVAMANLYLADWDVIFDRPERALESYTVAYRNFALAGIDVAALEQYFAVPSLLPEISFHSDLEQAVGARIPADFVEPNSLDSAQASLYYAEWSPNLPYVRAPFTERSNSADSNFALFSFNLSGVTEITRWLNRGSATSFGQLLNVTLLQPNLPSAEMEEKMRERIERLHFRPRLEQGMPAATEATLVYKPALALN